MAVRTIPLALIGCQVRRVSFDFQVRLALVALAADEGYRVDAELVLETPFLLKDTGDDWHELDPANAGSSLAPVIDLFAKTITSVAVKDRGTLTLDFDNGARLFIAPHSHYESWQLTGNGVTPVLVGPGGEPDWLAPQ